MFIPRTSLLESGRADMPSPWTNPLYGDGTFFSE